jgi:hypothetical protein
MNNPFQQSQVPENQKAKIALQTVKNALDAGAKAGTFSLDDAYVVKQSFDFIAGKMAEMEKQPAPSSTLFGGKA